MGGRPGSRLCSQGRKQATSGCVGTGQPDGVLQRASWPGVGYSQLATKRWVDMAGNGFFFAAPTHKLSASKMQP